MKIDVRVQGLRSSRGLRQHARRRIETHLGRFAEEITAVDVRVADVNGDKGGVDKRCQVQIRGPRLGTSVVKSSHENAYAALTGALMRVAQVAGKRLQRDRSRRHAIIRSRGTTTGAM